MSLARTRSWVAYAGLAAVAGDLVRLASQRLHNTDTYFHLRFGHEFLTGDWSPRSPGSVSTFATADWVPTQWLSEVVMAQVEEWFGLPGVAWLSGLLFLGLALVVYWVCRQHAEPLVATILVALVLVACSSGLSMRPQVVSYLLVVVTTGAWLRARRTGRAPWVLVPLTWVWAMSHGMFPVGVVIGVGAVLGLALDRRLGELGRMAAVPALSVLVSMLTPVGPRLLPAVLRVTGRSQYFYEWDPPDFTDPVVMVLLLLLALAVVPRMRGTRPVPWFDIVLLGLAVLWAVYSQRTVPVAACLAGPLAAAALQPHLGRPPPVGGRERSAMLCGYAAALVLLALVVPHIADRPRVEPALLDADLRDLPAGTVVLDDQGLGGYLMWAHPQLDLVSHGYGDAFTDSELERNATIAGVRDGWVELVRDTRAEYALLPDTAPLAYGLRSLEGWSVVDADGGLELLTAPPGWND